MFEHAYKLNEEENVEDEVGSNGHSLDLSTAHAEAGIAKSSPNRGRRRAFSFASSSEGSLSVRLWPHTGIGLTSAFLIGRRGGPGTPVPSWKVSDNSVVNTSFEHHHHPLHLKHDHIVEGLHISARKLAAALWELQKLSPLKATRAENFRQAPQDMDTNASPTKQPSTLHGQTLSAASSRISKGSCTRPPVYMKFGDHGRTRTKVDRRKGQQLMPVKKEIVGDESATSLSERMVLSSRDDFSNLGSGPTTASKLVKVLNHVWSLEEQHASSMSLVGTLRIELEDARAQLQELLSNEKSHREEVENISKRIAEEQILRQDQHEQSIRVAVQSVRQELENERKSKQKLKMLHKKLAREFRDTKKTIVRAMEDLTRERKARQLMEEVCDELAREIGQDKTRVEELKRESVKVREEVEEERKMLQMAEVWREERVQMKLMEAKLELEKKNTALDKLRGQLEAFLEAKRASNSKEGQGHATNDGRLDVGRCSVDMIVGQNLLDPFHSRDQTVLMSRRNSVDSSCGHGMKQSAWMHDFNDDDDDLHSIELNRDPLGKTATTEWGLHSFQPHSAEYQQERRRSDEKMLVESRLEADSIERLRNVQRDRKGRQVAKAKEVVPAASVSQGFQWIRHNGEGSEKRGRSQEQQHEGLGESSKSWQSDTEELHSQVSSSPKAMSRSLQGQSESIMRAARGSSNRVDKKASKSSSEWQQQIYHNGRWQPNLPADGPAFYGSDMVFSPTRKWNKHIPPADFNGKFSNEALYGSTLKSKLLESKVESQQAEQKRQ